MILFRNADTYAPEHLGMCDLLIVEDRIAWIGTKAPPLADAYEVTEVDLDGARVFPGLIDGHVHVTGGGGEAGARSRVPPVGVSRFTGAGVTTVVGLLGTDDVTRNTGSLLAAARGLEEEGLTAFCYTGGYHLPPTTLTGSVQGDIVHVDRVIGVGETAISDHRSSQPTTTELIRLASDAHVAGMMTGKAGTLHLHVGDGKGGLEPVRCAMSGSDLPASVFHPTHVNRSQALLEEAAALTQHGVTIDITSMPPDVPDDGCSAAEALDRLWGAGAGAGADIPANRITVSSDAGGCFPEFGADGRITRYDVGKSGALMHTIRTLTEAGHHLGQVLAPFTSNVADLLRLRRKGQLAAGADADLVVVDASLVVTDVMARGVWHVHKGEQVIHGAFEATP